MSELPLRPWVVTAKHTRRRIAAGLAAALVSPAAAQAPSSILFAHGADTLDARARQQLDEVVKAYRRTGQVQIVLGGHTSRAGEAEANIHLSQRRAMAVRDLLAASGVPSAAISTKAYGEERPAFETPDGVRRPENERVEVVFGPVSAW